MEQSDIDRIIGAILTLCIHLEGDEGSREAVKNQVKVNYEKMVSFVQVVDSEDYKRLKQAGE